MSTELSTAKQQTVVHQPDTGADSLMRIIDRAAQSPDFDVDKLAKLLEVRERWEATEARKAFVAALNAFKADPPTLVKNKHVEFNKTKYDHATLDHVSSEIGAALSRHGISHRWETEQLDGGQIRVTCVLTHEQGHSERTPLQAGADQSGAKNNIQAIGSTVTYLQRYTLLSATGMAVAGMDDDGGGAEPIEHISESQAADIEALLTEVGADKQKFLRYLKVASIAEIPQQAFRDAIKALERKRRQS